MKTNYFKSTAFAVLTGLFLLGCGTGKNVMASAPIDQSHPKTVAPSDQSQPKMPPGEQALITFCMDESYDKPGEYMGGLGIIEGKDTRDLAILEANGVAVADIASRYIGVIKNAIDRYSKDVNVPSSKKLYESSFENGVAAIGSKVIEKYANTVCRQLAINATGGYVGYVAVRVMLSDANKGLAEELEVRKVDYDKKKFFEKMDAELATMAAKQKAELDAMRE